MNESLFNEERMTVSAYGCFDCFFFACLLFSPHRLASQNVLALRCAAHAPRTFDISFGQMKNVRADVSPRTEACLQDCEHSQHTSSPFGIH
jgi:hypothetical protein